MFLSRFHDGALMEKLETLADVASARAVDQLPAPQRAILTANIVEKLAQQYSGQDTGLTTFVLDKVNSASPYGSFDKSESSKVGSGTSTPGQPVKETCVICIPSSANAASFRSSLETTFRGQLPPSIEQVRVQQEGVPDNEITIYQIHNLFPVRWIAHTAFLRDKYDATVKANPASAYFVHGEGTARDYPPIFIPSAGDLTKQITPHLLLAFAMGLLTKSKSATTGKDEITYKFADADGFDNQLSVGATESEALSKMPSDTALTIQRRVDEALASESFRLADQRELAFKSVVAFINGYKDNVLHGDANSAEYLRLRQAAMDANSRLLKLS